VRRGARLSRRARTRKWPARVSRRRITRTIRTIRLRRRLLLLLSPSSSSERPRRRRLSCPPRSPCRRRLPCPRRRTLLRRRRRRRRRRDRRRRRTCSRACTRPEGRRRLRVNDGAGGAGSGGRSLASLAVLVLGRRWVIRRVRRRAYRRRGRFRTRRRRRRRRRLKRRRRRRALKRRSPRAPGRVVHRNAEHGPARQLRDCRRRRIPLELGARSIHGRGGQPGRRGSRLRHRTRAGEVTEGRSVRSDVGAEFRGASVEVERRRTRSGIESEARSAGAKDQCEIERASSRIRDSNAAALRRTSAARGRRARWAAAPGTAGTPRTSTSPLSRAAPTASSGTCSSTCRCTRWG
jgi:hypothetical protein